MDIILDKRRLKDKRVKKVIVIDTETAPFYETVKQYETWADEEPKYNVIPSTLHEEERRGRVVWVWETDKKQKQIVFDIGYTIADKKGNILAKRRHLVQEVFTDMNVMRHAHYFNKYPEYLMEITRGEVDILPWIEIIQEMERDIFNYGVKEVYAYNMAFDKRAINDTHRIVGHRNNFNMWKMYDLKTNCLWGMACETILQQKAFINVAIDNEWTSEIGNIKTSAETAYRFITQSYDFEEAHTALDDAIIETAIMARCFRSHKKMSFGIIPQPWRLVKERAEQLGVR